MSTTHAQPPAAGAPAVGRRAARKKAPARRKGIGPWTGTGLTIGLLTFWFILQTLVLGNVAQHRSQVTLYDSFRESLAKAEVPVEGLIEAGTPVALVKIPSIGLEQVVVEGTASGDLLAGPGHRRNSVLPGQAGVSLVYGRARTYGAPFSRVPQLAKGDQISTISGLGEGTYTVTGIRRAGDPQPQPLADGQGRLTLVTASGSDSLLSPLSPGQVVYVDAKLTSKPLEASAHPGMIGDWEAAMGQDTRRLPLLTIALAGLIVLGITVSWAARRWPLAFVWLVLAPVAIALTWFTVDIVMTMLPNLM